MSTTFPFPSSPHWAPTTTTFAMSSSPIIVDPSPAASTTAQGRGMNCRWPFLEADLTVEDCLQRDDPFMPVVHPDHPHLRTLCLNHQDMTKGHPPRIGDRLFQAAGDD